MKICIIGGGVAGLVSGIYLQKNGFSTEIIEQNNTCGGLCTGWKRGAYAFNGCMHWLLGSHKGISFNTFWNEVVDMKQITFVEHEERVQFDVPGETDRHGNSVFHFYNDADKFEEYMKDIAPEDACEIKKWMNEVRFLGKYLNDLPPVFYDNGIIKHVIKYVGLSRLLPVVWFMLKWHNVSNFQFSKRFKNPFLRKAITLLYEKEMQMQVLLFVQSYAHEHVAGYPIGASQHFAELLTNSYIKHGGRLRLNSTVESIDVADGKAKSVTLSGGETLAYDAFVSAADWRWTMLKALGGKFLTKKQLMLTNPPKEYFFYSFCILYLGVKKNLDNIPHFIRYALDEPLTSPDGTLYKDLEVQIYNYDKTLAPEGCVTMAVDFQTREFDFWNNLRKNNFEKYCEVKRDFKNRIIELLEKKIPSITGNIEVADLTTPATYFRYTGNSNGSSQGWTPQSNLLNRLQTKQTIKGIDNVFLAGHWMEAGGGLPIALKSARDVAWIISKKYNGKFRV